MTETKQDYKIMTDEQLAHLSFPLPLKAQRVLRLVKERQSLILGAFCGERYNLERIEDIDAILEE